MVELSTQFGSPYFTKGGQGKLFHDPKPTNDHRYQAGYTPDRMAAVQQAHIDVNSGPEGHFGGPAGRHRALGVIARSKTPIREFNDAPVKVAIDRSYMSGEEGAHYAADDLFPLHINMAVNRVANTGLRRQGAAVGNYSGGGNWERGDINVGANHHETEEHAGQSLIHELGHYKSAKVLNTQHQEWYGRDPASTGREEAIADDNMVSRWRPDPRDVRAGKSNPKRPTYEWSGAFHGMGGRKAHGPYVTARTTLSKSEKKSIKERGDNLALPHERYSSTNSFTTEHDGNLHQYNRHEGKWQEQGALFHPMQFGDRV